MKKRLSYIFCIILLTTTACVSGSYENEFTESSQSTTTNNNESVTSSPTPSVTPDTRESNESKAFVGFIYPGPRSDWMEAQVSSIKESFISNSEIYEFLSQNVDSGSAEHWEIMNDYIDKGVDYIILMLGWWQHDPMFDAALGRAKDAGIHVVFTNFMDEIYDQSLVTSYVGLDFHAHGRDAATAVEMVLEKKNISDTEDVNIVLLHFEIGLDRRNYLTEGFLEQVEKHSNWNLLDMRIVELDWTLEKPRIAMEDLLNEYDDIDVIVALHERLVLGAIEALNESERTSGPNGDISVISIDATRHEFEAMIDGNLDASVEFNPLFGPFVEEIIRTLESGEQADRIVYVPGRIFFAHEAAMYIDERTY